MTGARSAAGGGPPGGGGLTAPPHTPPGGGPGGGGGRGGGLVVGPRRRAAPPRPRGAPAQGLLAGRSAQLAVAWLEGLAAEAWVRVEPGSNGRLELTEAGRRLLLDPAASLVASPPLDSAVAARRPAPAELPEVEAALRPLLGRLRRLRWRLALRLQVEPYRLFSNRTLLELVRRRPRTLVELLLVPGFGPWRIERIGRQVLNAVADESALVDRTERTSGNQADADPPPG